MKKKIQRIMSGVVASALISSALPFSVNAEDESPVLCYRITDNSAVVTDCLTTDAQAITIPESIVADGISYTVTGVDDFAFGYCDDLSVVNVPSTLKNEFMGNIAFQTASSIVDFMNHELGEDATTEDVVLYVAEKINYKNGNYTEADVEEINQKLMSHLNKVDTSTAETLEGKVMTLMKNIDKMGLSETTLIKFDLWIAGVPYSNMTLRGEENTEIHEYALGREFLGLNYEVVNSGYETKIMYMGDANEDGKVNVRDAAYIAKVLAIRQEYILPIYADFNEDGDMNVRDAAALARALSAPGEKVWKEIILQIRPI